MLDPHLNSRLHFFMICGAKGSDGNMANLNTSTGLTLELSVPGEPSYQMGALPCRATLFSSTDVPLKLPALSDRSGVLIFEIFDQLGNLVRRQSAATQQTMQNAGTNALPPIMQTLPPNGHLTEVFDLSAQHYPLPIGCFEVQCRLDIAEEDVHLVSKRVDIEVVDGEVEDVLFLRDNPMLDSLSVFLRSGNAEQSLFHLRQYATGRPLAARHARRLLARPEVGEAFVAEASDFVSDTVDRLYQRWMVWAEGDSIFAHKFFRGNAVEGSIRRANLPDGCRLLRQAYFDANDHLHIFLIKNNSILTCHRFEAESLEQTIIYYLPTGMEIDPIISVDSKSIHIGIAKRGFSYVRLSHQGAMQEICRLHESRSRTHSGRFDRQEGAFKLLYWNGPHSKTLETVIATVSDRTLWWRKVDQLPLRGEPTEVAFERDARGCLHLLVATSRNRLYHLEDERAPWLLARGQKRYFPYVVANQQVYLGAYFWPKGYRFLELEQAKGKPRIVNFDVS